MAEKGQHNWVFADGNPYSSDAVGYEELTVTNLNETAARLTFDIYFTDRAPVKGLTYTVEAERVTSFRLDMPICDQEYKLPRSRYSLVLHSNVPVVATFGRQTGTSYCTVQGYAY